MVMELYALKDLPIIKLDTNSKSLREHLETTRIITGPCCQVDTACLREIVEIRKIDPQ